MNVDKISALHARTLNAIDQGMEEDEAQLDKLAAETQKLNRDVKERIKSLEGTPVGHDAQIRKNRVRLRLIWSLIIIIYADGVISDSSCSIQVLGSNSKVSAGRTRL